MACLALALPLGVPVIAACRRLPAMRFVALQVLVALATVILVLLSFALNQSSFVDLPLALALLSLPGSLLMALFLERWL
jgi:multicomponent Na+:H+ antiporter subunit F